MSSMAAVANNNPAVTAPASQKVPPPLSPSPSHRDGPPESRSSSQSTSNTQVDTPASPSPSPHPSQYRPPNKHDVGWRRIIRNFSPSWFSITMGTGIVSIIFTSIPWQAPWLYYLSLTFFILNALLFSLASLTSILRYTLYPEIFPVMLADPTNSLFLSTIPMGFATLIEGWIFLLVPHWGPWARYAAWGAWMLDAVVAFGVTAFLSWNLISLERTGTSLARITAAQLLPIAATLVAAGTGAEVVGVLPAGEEGKMVGTLLACYVMWGAGMPLALTVIVVYYQRLAVHKLPAREIIVSSFLPLGPLGFGGYGIMYMGKVALTLFPETGTLHPLAGPMLYCLGFITALIFFGFAIMWLIFALAAISKAHPFPFNMGWWGFTFPLGVLACSVIQIGVELPSAAFKGIGTALGVAVIILWCVVAAGTVKGAWDGKLFHAPCLANLKRREDEEKQRDAEGREKAV